MTGKLTEYNQKRNFEKTPEPAGESSFSDEGLRFVVQHHMARKEHYDLRLEWAGVLLSWAVPKGPSYNTRVRRLAVRVEDHPLDYRNFEGTIPKGEYGGGTVMLWDEGFWEPLGNVEDSLEEGMLKFKLMGRRLKGKWALIRLKQAGQKEDNWLLLKERDEYAADDDGISQFNTSVRTGRTMEEIEKGEEDKFIKNPFDRVEPQLAQMVKELPKGDDWIYELKYDGYRIIAFIEAGNVRLISRNGNDFSGRFHSIASSLAEMAKGRPMVLDGELAVTDEKGKTDFSALQSYLSSPGGKNLVYIIFDLLALDGSDLRGLPLLQRKEMLEKLLSAAPKNLYYSRHVTGCGKECLEAACESGMEGIVAKKANSVYSGGRRSDWLKIKCDRRQEFVIGGYTISDKRNGGVSSLLLGVYEGDELVYVGRAGTGISEAEMRRLEEKFKDIIMDSSPFAQAPRARADERIVWLKPLLVAEIKFAEWTQDNMLRQASYKGLRTDKEPKAVRREQALSEDDYREANYQFGEDNKKEVTDRPVNEEGLQEATDKSSYEERKQAEKSASVGEDRQEHDKADYKEDELDRLIHADADSLIIHGIKISNPGKIIFDEPRLSKEDIVRYYAAVSGRMLPFVSNRLLTAIRCPKGISQTCFYKKHPGPGSKEIIVMPAVTDEGEKEDYFYIENTAGLIEEVQMGTVEFHIWGSRVSALDMPDMMVFDLDPDVGMEPERIRQGVLDLKSILDELGLRSFLKTSGGKGYHVVLPFEPAAGWEQFSEFARMVAQVMEQKWPDRYTSNIRKNKRTGRIFIDWVRNTRAATSVAPYSIRARKGARISMPIAWDELDAVAPDGITLSDALERVTSEDPWKGFFEIGQRLR